MPRAHMVYRFGAFELDPANRHLTTGAEIVSLTDPQSAMLLRLVSSAPDVVDKDDLAKTGWGGAAVSPNSIEQAISLLRRTLSQEADGGFIETVRHRGYRFVAPLQQIEREDAAAAGKSPDLRPFLSFLQGSRDLATLNRDAIVEARRAFEHSVEQEPRDAAAHALLAMACALIYEGSRIQPTRDVESLTRAVHHAQLATTIDPARADGWSTLGFALLMRGNMDAAPAAARKAVVLEPEGWRHWLRLAYVSWGEERVEAAQRALALRPDLAMAHWLKSTVLIARGASNAALISIQAGCEAQDKQWSGSRPYPAVGLHLLHGLVLAAQGRLDDAMREFEDELNAPDHGQLYARECAANTWYARGAIHLRRAEHDAAEMSFRHALDIEPGHYCSMGALGLPMPAAPSSGLRGMDAAIGRSILLARQGRHPEAAETYGSALNGSSPLYAGWILPVEPILHVSAHPQLWSAVLTIVQQRAT